MNDNDRERLLTDQVRILRSNVEAGMIGNLIVLAVFLMFAIPVVDRLYLIPWVSMFMLSLLVRTVLCWYMKTGFDQLPARSWLILLTGTSVMMGVVWGSIVFLHRLSPDGFPEVFAGIIVAGLATIAVLNGVAHRYTILAFLVPVLTPFILYQFFQGTRFDVALGLLISLFAGYLLITSFRMNDRIVKSLILSIDNEKLLAETAQITRSKVDEHAQERIRFLLDKMGAGVLLVDRECRHVLWNQAYKKIFGFEDGFLSKDMTLRETLEWYFDQAGYCEEDVDRIVSGFFEDLEKVRGGKRQVLQVDMADGRIIDVTADFGTEGDIIFNFLDVTKREKANAEALFHMGQRDSLTGLPNRFLLKSHLKKILNRARHDDLKFSLTLLNVDNFQFANETYGLSSGDLLLNTIGWRLNTALGENEFLSHMGGDSFAIIGDYYTDRQQVLAHIRDLLALFQQPFTFVKDGAEIEIVVGMSAGVTFCPSDDKAVDDILLNAEIALSIAKKQSPGELVEYDPKMHAQIKNRNLLVTSIRDSLATRQFLLHYQPQISLKTRKVSGFEALLRWHHPIRGWISPAEFIPLAELSKQIIPLTEQFLPVACAQARSWHDQGLGDLVVSVNISPPHFLDDGFVPFIRQCLESTDLAAKCLELEITEGIIMSHSKETIAKLEELSVMGVRLSIDDFGTGYSSLTYLRTLPVDKLKIDQAFISDMVEEGDARSVIEAIIKLGHSFNLQITAEGVESEKELELLAQMRCDFAQGYFISRPLTVDKVEEWLTAYNRDTRKQA